MPRIPRLLILAQSPPPTHGQSVMVGHLVNAATARFPDKVVHVNLLLSRDEQDVGTMRPAKLFALASCTLKALATCLFKGAREIYYVPAPGKRGPVIRDVLLLSILRPFTSRLILHWHSVGLGAYLADHPNDPWARRLHRLLLNHSLSLCLSNSSATDVAILKPARIAIVPNGIPDPCPDFPPILAARQSRLAARKAALANPDAPPAPVHLLYLGLCVRSKGIFDALDTAAALTAHLNSRHPACPVTLTVAGPFRSDTDATEFHNAVAAARASLPTNLQPLFSVNLPGFTGPDEKKALLAAADLFVFPTRYENEGLPLTILEALAFGLPVLSTQWRGIPEALPPDYPWLAHPDNLTQLPALAADALVADPFLPLRSWFTKGFTLESHLAQILALLVPPNNPTSP